MKLTWNVLRAMQHCSYKAWLLSKEIDSEEIQQERLDEEGRLILTARKITTNDKLFLTAQYLQQESTREVAEILCKSSGGETFQTSVIRLSKHYSKAQQLLNDAQNIIGRNEPPPFYKNPHCPECQFRNSCYEKLKHRDCISLLAGMSPKVLSKYHKKGITSITQLSHLFRPRRRRGRPYKASTFLWELRALAIREQKTFVLHPPGLTESSLKIIYLDFEGMPEESWVYLLGGFIKQEGKPDEAFSFWANDKGEEKENFQKLFALFREHPDAHIYHYGSYESKALRSVEKKWKGIFKQDLPQLEKRMVNLLSFLRTHVYPPTYSNGLKELGGFLGFHWSDEEADGLKSIEWRKKWEGTKENVWKEKLVQYNHDDCMALEKVNQWFNQLTTDSEKENVQQVSVMKRQSPFKFQDNPHYGEDYKYISKAAYFDYQRKKIYWRGQKKSSPISNFRKQDLQKQSHKGIPTWKPKKVNEVIIAPPIKKCPRCGHKKIYQIRTRIGMARQTDLKFTSTGIKQWVIEYRSAQAKCAKCRMNLSNRPLRMVHYGDNLFAWAINLYVSYHISHEMIARMLKEQFGIFMNPVYLIARKNKWCSKWKSEVDYIWQIIRESPVIHIDETTIRLSKEKGYVWVFATSQTVFYHFTISHEADFLKDWLKEYKGIIVTDFFPAYEILPVKRQKCLIHLIRDLNDDLYKNPFDEEYKALVDAFGKMLRNIIGTVDRYGLKKVHLQKHLKDIEKFSKEFEVTHKSELSVKYTKRLKKHWEQLWTFLHHDNIPWNNNNAEVAIKAFAQHRRGVNGQVSEKGIREYLEMLSIAQTCRYRNISFLNFLQGKAGLWENINPEALPGFLPFTQARLFIHKLNFQRKSEWQKWKVEKRPSFIPSSPHLTYLKKGWIDWHDWLGFSFLPFPEARTYMRRLGLKNRDAYWAWLKSGKRPKTIPYSPEKVYKHTGWKDLGDWLGTGNTGQQRKPRMSYEQAKKYVQAVGLKTQQEFFQWRKTKERPDTIPPDPKRVYAEFKSWGEFLGTERIANQNKEYGSYEETKSFLKPFGIRSMEHYYQLCKMDVIPNHIPKRPYAYYRKQGTWVSVSDFLGK